VLVVVSIEEEEQEAITNCLWINNREEKWIEGKGKGNGEKGKQRIERSSMEWDERVLEKKLKKKKAKRKRGDEKQLRGRKVAGAVAKIRIIVQSNVYKGERKKTQRVATQETDKEIDKQKKADKRALVDL
jgi:hypothetical protein